jgi:hypothetical protein
MLPTTFELPASDTLRQIDEGFRRNCKVHKLCKSAADGCHLCTLLLIGVPDTTSGSSNYNRWKVETLVSMKLRPARTTTAFGSKEEIASRSQYEMIFTLGSVQNTCSIALDTKPSTTSELQELPCRSIFTGSDECIERCRLWLQ